MVNIGLGAGAAITLPFWGTAAIASVAAGWAVYEGAQIVKKWNHQDDLRLTKAKRVDKKMVHLNLMALKMINLEMLLGR